VRILPKVFALLGTSALAVGLLAGPASAAKPGGPAAGSNGLDSAKRNCVVELQRGANPAPVLQCYSTFTEAIKTATHGAITNAAGTAAAALGDSSFRAKINGSNLAAQPLAAASVVGIEYEALNFSTTSWSFTFNGPTACTLPVNDIDYSVDLPSPVWDQISSFQTLFSGTICLADHYYLSNFGLPHTGFVGSSSPVPSMNVGGGPFNGDNNTRSITWS
jgi:hypothetical protein